MQQPVHLEITEPTRDAARIVYAGLSPEATLVPGRLGASSHLSTGQCARIADVWVKQAGLKSAFYGTHTLRRTKATLIYRRSRHLRAVQLLLGHLKPESNVRYLGTEVDDAPEIAEETEV